MIEWMNEWNNAARSLQSHCKCVINSYCVAVEDIMVYRTKTSEDS
jgi:hypothetical protein